MTEISGDVRGVQPAPGPAPEPVTIGAPRPVRRRRWPGTPARLSMAVSVGERIGQISDLERFLTARWGLHTAWYGGGLRYLPNQHPPWPLHRAALLRLEENLLAAAGLPPPAGAPVSVLYSPGVPVRVGLPQRSRLSKIAGCRASRGGSRRLVLFITGRAGCITNGGGVDSLQVVALK